MEATVQLTKIQAGHYTFEGFSVIKEETDSGQAFWNLEYPDGDWTTCRTLREAKSYIKAEISWMAADDEYYASIDELYIAPCARHELPRYSRD